MRKVITLVVVHLILGFNLGNSARILGIFPVPSISHQVVFRGLTLALNKRGHDLVVVTPNPINDPSLTNYTEIDMNVLYKDMQLENLIDVRRNKGWLQLFMEFSTVMHNMTEIIFQKPEFRRIYGQRSNEKFDLLIVEMLSGQAFYALAARFNVPIIGITSLGLGLSGHYAVSNPILTSHPSNWELEMNAGYHRSFWKRLENFIESWKYIRYFQTQYIPRQQEIANKYLGNDIPYVGDIEKNMSLVFINQQDLLSYARPMAPKVIKIGGFHVMKEVQSLPKDLKKFLDDASEGFVYMSLGSNVKSQMLSNSTKEDLMAVFSKLPQRVLWKFEDDTLPGKPENVLISKWLPQQAVLDHHNVKVFIYQGGLQSTEEAVSHAVPLIGLPVFADQDSQVSKMVSLGVARSLEILDLNRNDLEEALDDVINNKIYKEKMLKLRSLLNDRPYHPLENAVWWTEFVIRHKGAPQLRWSAVDEPWYQQYDVDIVAFFSVAAVIMIMILVVISYRIIIYSLRLFGTSVPNRKQKVN